MFAVPKELTVKLAGALAGELTAASTCQCHSGDCAIFIFFSLPAECPWPVAPAVCYEVPYCCSNIYLVPDSAVVITLKWTPKPGIPLG